MIWAQISVRKIVYATELLIFQNENNVVCYKSFKPKFSQNLLSAKPFCAHQHTELLSCETTGPICPPSCVGRM